MFDRKTTAGAGLQLKDPRQYARTRMGVLWFSAGALMATWIAALIMTWPVATPLSVVMFTIMTGLVFLAALAETSRAASKR